jgi:hypothetical protein
VVKKLTVLIPDDLHTKLKLKAALDNTTITDIIVKVIENIEDPRDSALWGALKLSPELENEVNSKTLHKDFKTDKKKEKLTKT